MGLNVTGYACNLQLTNLRSRRDFTRPSSSTWHCSSSTSFIWVVGLQKVHGQFPMTYTAFPVIRDLCATSNEYLLVQLHFHAGVLCYYGFGVIPFVSECEQCYLLLLTATSQIRIVFSTPVGRNLCHYWLNRSSYWCSFVFVFFLVATYTTKNMVGYSEKLPDYQQQQIRDAKHL